MEQRLSLITLAVENLERSVAFYEHLGWKRAPIAAEGVAFFQLGGMGLSLFPRDSLAEDAGLTAFGDGFRGFALAHNLRSREAVDVAVAEFLGAGGKLIRAAEAKSWGGYSAYVADLDGFLWELAWNPGFPIAEDGSIRIAG